MVDEFGRSQLHYACNNGDADSVAELIRAGEDVNLADKQEWTPLHFAAQSSNVSVVAQLLQAGAFVDPTDNFGNTPLARAVFNSRVDGGVITILRDAGADPYLENHHGVSPLALARSIGNRDVAQCFSDLPGLDNYDD